MVAGAVVDFNDAEDVVGQVAEIVVRKFGEYDPARPFVAWALGVARNQVLQHYERRAGQRHAYFDEQTLEILEAAQVEIADELPARLAALKDCMDQIRGKSRRVLEMRYVHDLKPEVVAEALGMSRNAVWVMLHRIRTALKECIEQKLVTER
jgi:RNA polymerase sigma-70 factor, ECF subfamily